jgi:hypothetical protein
MKGFPCAGHFFEEIECLRGPDEWFWTLVVFVDELSDSHDAFFVRRRHLVDDAAPDFGNLIWSSSAIYFGPPF